MARLFYGCLLTVCFCQPEIFISFHQGNQTEVLQSEASGLRWGMIGYTRPSKGRDLTDLCPQLAQALTKQTQFSEDEWAPLKVHLQAVDVQDLMWSDFIRSDEAYYSPQNSQMTSSINQAMEIADMLKSETDILCWVSQRPPINDESKRKHWLQTLRAIKECKIFLVILSDSYCTSKACRREFQHAVQSGKYMIPVLISEHEENGNELPAEHQVSYDILLHAGKFNLSSFAY